MILVSLLIIFTCIFCMLSSPETNQTQKGCPFDWGSLGVSLTLEDALAPWMHSGKRQGECSHDGVSSDRVDLTRKNAATGNWQQPIPRDPCRALQPLFCHYGWVCLNAVGRWGLLDVSLQPIHCWSHQLNPIVLTQNQPFEA